jgi:signal transduction histidine kinase
MLTSGMVRDETRREEYLNTLNNESERLHRLISNVLDFARLEKQSAQPTLKPVATGEILNQLRDTWSSRCEDGGKSLTIASDMPSDTRIHTDLVLAQQILGNLIDNACKYSKSSPDNRVFVRAIPAGMDHIAFEVEDCGPGVSRREWRSVFRPFRRGRGADTTAGGVGLGLALANRWSRMLGGKLRLCRGQHGNGACFRVELPRSCR